MTHKFSHLFVSCASAVIFILLSCKLIVCDNPVENDSGETIPTSVIKSELPVVETSHGKLQGITLVSRSGRNYDGYLGIRYAPMPRRFEDSELTTETWEDTRPAMEFGSPCPQSDFVMPEEFLGNEDCLFLNVYRPKVRNTRDLLPVMVFIHGGAFMGGSGDEYGAKYFMDENVILVTLNYRVGALGFLSTEDLVATGNWGLKDQIVALKWIQANIQDFGGNPGQVTIFGNSAGAACVSFLILSPMSKGLFSYAISQSGTALSPWAVAPQPRTYAKRLGGFHNCPGDDTEVLVKCLRNIDVQQLVQSQQKFTKWHSNPSTPFSPVVEYFVPSRSNVPVFLPDTPRNLLKSGTFQAIPWITGVVEDEGILLHAETILADKKLTEDLNNDWNRVAPITFLYEEDFPEKSQSDKDALSRQIRQFYFGDEPVSKVTRKNLTNVYSDRYFIHGVHTSALLHARQAPVFTYIFGFRGDFGFLRFYGVDDVQGVTHADDLQYFFNTTSSPELEKGSESDKFSMKIVKLWTSFAESGKPKETWFPEKEWRPFEVSETRGFYPMHWYKLDYETQLLEEPFTDRMQFWDNLLHPTNSEGTSGVPVKDEF